MHSCGAGVCRKSLRVRKWGSKGARTPKENGLEDGREPSRVARWLLREGKMVIPEIGR